ncbi:MAG: ral secretion pathway protein [Pseudomonadota bacterium]|nr:ral secretion pathway protein [Pseudomonadota bacterium]
MSYILEALKKSQQERSRGQVPDLQTLHQSVAVAGPSTARWPYWVAGALGITLLALVFLLGWLRPWAEPAAPPAATGPAAVAAAVETPAPPTVSVPPAPVMAPPPSLSPVAKPVMTEAPRQEIQPDAVPFIEQLPSLLQQSIPSMQFAGHVYSANPRQRSVIINGRSMSEGDALLSGLTLLQITPDSVIFDYQGQLFRVPVLHDWSFQ